MSRTCTLAHNTAVGILPDPRRQPKLFIPFPYAKFPLEEYFPPITSPANWHSLSVSPVLKKVISTFVHQMILSGE